MFLDFLSCLSLGLICKQKNSISIINITENKGSILMLWVNGQMIL